IPCVSSLPFPPRDRLKTRRGLAMEMREEKGDMGGWETPKRGDCRIPAAIRCPPPPRKKKRCPTAAGALGKRRGPPRNGYFHPPDLEALFVLAPRREACA
ncbi:unnamed protein product, partial [Musa acuminata subsp. burmannicoides]